MHTYVVMVKPGDDGHRATVFVVTAANKRDAERMVRRGGRKVSELFIVRATGNRGARRCWSMD